MMERYNIPDLSNLHELCVHLTVRKYLVGYTDDLQTNVLVLNFVRLVDLAIDEYNLGRKAKIKAKSTSLKSLMGLPMGLPMVGQAIRSSSHFEVCISTTKRAIDHLKAIRSLRTAPQELKDLCPRKATVLQDTVGKQVKDLRDMVIHLEERIIRSEFEEGQKAALHITETHIELGAEKILISDLVLWLQELHSIAHRFIDYFES
jgi:hypothetical protein